MEFVELVTAHPIEVLHDGLLVEKGARYVEHGSPVSVPRTVFDRYGIQCQWLRSRGDRLAVHFRRQQLKKGLQSVKYSAAVSAPDDDMFRFDRERVSLVSQMPSPAQRDVIGFRRMRYGLEPETANSFDVIVQIPGQVVRLVRDDHRFRRNGKTPFRIGQFRGLRDQLLPVSGDSMQDHKRQDGQKTERIYHRITLHTTGKVCAGQGSVLHPLSSGF